MGDSGRKGEGRSSEAGPLGHVADPGGPASQGKSTSIERDHGNYAWPTGTSTSVMNGKYGNAASLGPPD